MTQRTGITLFEDSRIRVAWDDEDEKYYFSIVDIVQVLTDSVDGRKYWNKLKQRLKAEGFELVTNCHQLKLPAADGKNYKTDVADLEGIFRIIQSIPSKKAEPVKRWRSVVSPAKASDYLATTENAEAKVLPSGKGRKHKKTTNTIKRAILTLAVLCGIGLMAGCKNKVVSYDIDTTEPTCTYVPSPRTYLFDGLQYNEEGFAFINALPVECTRIKRYRIDKANPISAREMIVDAICFDYCGEEYFLPYSMDWSEEFPCSAKIDIKVWRDYKDGGDPFAIITSYQVD